MKLRSTADQEPLGYWVGSNPPSGNWRISGRLISPSSGFREEPSNHQSFQKVAFLEQNLASFGSWKLILDELLRVLETGRPVSLEVRFRPTRQVTVYAFANFLFCRDDLSVQEFEIDDLGAKEKIYKISLIIAERLISTNFTVGVVTDGTRPDKVLELVKSVEESSKPEGAKIEILVCGPDGSAPESDLLQISLVKQPDRFQQRGWITAKKNLLVRHAAFQNVLIVHDRYVMRPDFFEQLAAFGYDYEVVSPGQLTTEGNRFPDWVATQALWSKSQSVLLHPHEYSDFAYINGGAILAKQEILLKHPWNELLFWREAEDVEISRRLQDNSVVLRYCSGMVLISTVSRPEYEASFLRGEDRKQIPVWKKYSFFDLLITLPALKIKDALSRFLVAKRSEVVHKPTTGQGGFGQ